MKNSQCRIISIASGKGGVGKTSFSLNLAYSLSREKKKVCIIDADLGLANIDVVLGITPKCTLEDVIFNGKSIGEVIYEVSEYIHLLPGSSGIPALADLSLEQRRKLIKSFSSLTGYDFVIIDNSPGIAPSVLSFCLSTKELIVLLTPEPTSITDGYALIKSLKENGLYYPPFVVLNRAKGKKQIKTVVNRFQDACKKFLGLSVLFLGAVFEDSLFQEELSSNMPISQIYPTSLPGRCYRLIAHRILTRPKQDLFYSDPKEIIKQSVIQFTARVSTPSRDNDRGYIDPISILESLRIQLENGVYGDKILLKKIKDELLMLENTVDNFLTARDIQSRVGVLSLDESMKNLIVDVLRDKNYGVVDLSMEDWKHEPIDLFVYYHIPNKLIPDSIKDIFNTNIPILLISSFNYYPPYKNIKGFLKTPFNIEDFYLEIQRIISND